MIGLGSNRLTIARRGGMSVRQIGSGGMRLVASPYSAQATAALNAQFPTQWPTIRDYGFAHPEIVGYMNAYAPEDAKIAYSLVPGLGVRTLTIRNKSVSNHLYNGVILPTQFSQIGLMQMTISAPNNNTMILAGATSNTGMIGYYAFGGSQSLGAGTITRIGTWTLNTLVSVGLNFTTNTKSQTIRIGGWTNTSWNYDLTIQQWDIYGTDDATLLYRLVPYMVGTEACLLNLVDGVVYHNVYTDPFTISETPAS